MYVCVCVCVCEPGRAILGFGKARLHGTAMEGVLPGKVGLWRLWGKHRLERQIACLHMVLEQDLTSNSNEKRSTPLYYVSLKEMRRLSRTCKSP